MAAELLLGLRWVLGIVFVTAGTAKVGAGRSLEGTIAEYRILPGILHRPVSTALPAFEVFLGGAFMLGVAPTIAGWTASGLLFGFGGAVAWNVARGRRFECGCGTTGQATIGSGLVLRDLILAAIAAAVAVGPSGSLALWSDSSTPPGQAMGTSELLPVPMIVILAVCAIRLLAANRPLWTAPRPREHPPNSPVGQPLVVQVSGNASAHAS
jgi:predicted ribosomally synthesized peptide with SipW-like signal peptide